MVSRVKVTFSGNIFTAERSSWGLHFYNNTLDGEASGELLQEYAEACAGVMQLHESDGLFAQMSTSASVNRVDTLYNPASGPSLFSGTAPVVSVTGAGTANRPAQVARVITLLTAINGRRYRGRFYLPSLVGTVNASGQDIPTQADVTNMADFIADLGNAWPGTGPLAPVVYSAVGDVVTAVTSIRVGSILDTQRRRSENLTETYLSAPVPP